MAVKVIRKPVKKALACGNCQGSSSDKKGFGHDE